MGASSPPRSSHVEQSTPSQTVPSNLASKIALRLPSILGAALYLIAAATASYVSQLWLAPVYGEIPSSLYHEKLTAALFFATWLGKGAIQKLPLKPSTLLPIVALYTPGILSYTFQFSSHFGPVYGPIITESLTYYPILCLSVFAATSLTAFDNFILDAIPASLNFVLFTVARTKIPGLIRNYIGCHWLMTRCGLTHVLAALYSLLSPSLLLITAVPALLHSTTTNNLCVTTPALNATLHQSNYTLIARQESNTGYISVLENFDTGYRVLRCDHSLLGGEWQRPPVGLEHMNYVDFKEPIYAVFVIMEAVRLIEPAPKNPNPRALAIGLGIGTSSDAFIKHGIETDIVELDPVVYRYAKEYFALSPNHTAYIEDAVGFVERESKNSDRKYDFILHDVFTGGAVPAPLFTLEFFKGLKQLLSEDGVIAINWAGDLKLKAARSIIETVRTVFNNCRAFREDMPEDEENNVDFTNMVLFCTRSEEPYQFRAPVESDFLNSYARRRYLFPRYEINLEKYWENLPDGGDNWMVLEDKTINELVEWQKISAVGHWEVIRTVVVDRVWENY